MDGICVHSRVSTGLGLKPPKAGDEEKLEEREGDILGEERLSIEVWDSRVICQKYLRNLPS